MGVFAVGGLGRPCSGRNLPAARRLVLDNIRPCAFTKWLGFLEYQVKGESNFDYGYNRLILHSEQNGVVNSTILSSGRTHEFWVDSLSGSTSSFSIRPRMEGGFYLIRSYSFAVLDSAGEWALQYTSELLEYLQPDSEPISRSQGCEGGFLSGPGDTLFFIDSSIPYGNEISGCISTRNLNVELPVWNDCVVQLYDLMYTAERGIYLLTGYSPILQLKHLTFDGTCELTTQVEAVAENVISHRAWGYALLTSHAPQVMIGQLDLGGQLIREPTPVLEGSHSMQDITIADNGDICMVWSGFVYPYGYMTRLMVIPWDAVLDTPKDVQPSVPSDIRLTTYPNPFNGTVRIDYELPRASDVSVGIFNTLGQQVAALYNGRADAGTHTLNWSPDAASGVYFVKLVSGEFVTSRKILYIR